MNFRLTDTEILSSATQSFVEQNENIRNLLGREHAFFSVEKAIEGKRNFAQSQRDTLVSVLESQYASVFNGSESDEAVLQSIRLLKQQDTYTICTGQQLHLFLGPAFVISKILAVINYAGQCREQFPELRFVPVFWMASEDHDVDEIRDNLIFKHNYKWETTQQGACGRFDVQSVLPLIETLREKIQLNATSSELLSKIEYIYTTSVTLSIATARLVHLLFGQYGLICLDADHPELKKCFVPYLHRDIEQSVNIEPYQAFSSRMETLGLSTQLGGREINCFYLGDGFRKRIVRNGEQYQVLDSSFQFTEQEISAEIDLNPEHFSPNALLRPLYQECLLPNIAYFGGNAEVNYWIQISILFDINKLSPPSLHLRPSMWIIPAKVMKWLEKHKINPSKLLINPNGLKLIDLLSSEVVSLQEEKEAFQTLKKSAQDAVAQHSNTALQELLNAGKMYEKALKSAEKAIEESLRNRNAQDLSKLEEYYNTYFNIKHLHDRNLHSLELLIKLEDVVNTVKNALNPPSGTGFIISI